MDIAEFLAANDPFEMASAGAQEYSSAGCVARAEVFYRCFEDHEALRHEQLTLANQALRAGPITVTTFNAGFITLFDNWVASCDKHGIEVRDSTLVFPTDKASQTAAMNAGFKCIYQDGCFDPIPSAAAGIYSDPTFLSCMFAKNAAIRESLSLDRDILFQDIDMVWLRDPIAPLEARAKSENIDMMFMYDGPNATYKPLHYNSGFLYIRPTKNTKSFWDFVYRNFDKVLYFRSQQLPINIILPTLIDRGLKTERLPENEYVNGHLVTLSSAASDLDTLHESTVVHVSWSRNLEMKLDKFKLWRLWYHENPTKTRAGFPKVRVAGSLFGDTEMSGLEPPCSFDWLNNDVNDECMAHVYADHAIRLELANPEKTNKKKIAWMTESPAVAEKFGLNTYVQDNAAQLIQHFDVVLTSNRTLCAPNSGLRYHPAANTRPTVTTLPTVAKTKLCSMFASEKKMLPGHILRQELAEQWQHTVDLYGGFKHSPINKNRLGTLAPYRFHVAIENCKCPLYFTEHLTDCFATLTVPVYWGSEQINEIFDPEGIIMIDQAFDIDSLCEKLYEDMLPAIRRNHQIVKEMESPADQLYRLYIE